jgi:hypothetical protein
VNLTLGADLEVEHEGSNREPPERFGTKEWKPGTSCLEEGCSHTVNGKTAFTREGPLSRLSPNPDWAVPNPQALYLGAWDSPLAIRKYALVPISGQGRRLR